MGRLAILSLGLVVSNPHFLTVYVLAVICVTTSAQAGERRVTVDSLLHLERGLSQEKVEEIFGTPARHEFSTKIDGRLLRCVSFSFDSKGRYYFVFTNDVLGKISAPPRFEFRRVPYENSWAEFPDRS